jgi:DNA processing protein
LNNSNLHYQIGLTFLYGIGPKKASLLVSKLGSVEAVFHEKLSTIHIKTGIGKNVLKQIDRKNALIKAEAEANYCVKNNIQTHFYLEHNYPRRLKQCEDAPLVLYSKGTFNCNPEKSVAIVGTRNATTYGNDLCEELISNLTTNNIQIVSGMAYGIDIIAHQLSVKYNLETIGILGHGLDRLYPSVHRKTAEMMFSNGGLLTEFIPGTKPDRENFPMRNRIVAGLSDATIVVESKTSGGSLITADLANDYNRDVFAFPGNVGQQYSAGCNQLIKQQKAQMILNANDFLTQMGWDSHQERSKQTIQRSCLVEMDDLEQTIFQSLEATGNEHIDVLSFKTKIPISTLNVKLFHLEMKGIVKTLPGKKYAIV